MGRFKLLVARLRQSNYQQDQTQLARDTMDLWSAALGTPYFIRFFFSQSAKKHLVETENGGQRRVGG